MAPKCFEILVSARIATGFPSSQPRKSQMATIPSHCSQPPISYVSAVTAGYRSCRTRRIAREEVNEENGPTVRGCGSGARRRTGAGEKEPRDRGEGSRQSVLRGNPPGLREVEQRECFERLCLRLHRPSDHVGRSRRSPDRHRQAERSKHLSLI